MIRLKLVAVVLAGVALFAACSSTSKSEKKGPVATPAHRRLTTLDISGAEFHINGKPTYAGRTWNGQRIQGLLLNSRMVQGIFDDENPATRSLWAYPDTKSWDPDRNTREFVAAMAEWRLNGLLAFTINLQGGSPQGYSKDQPWQNSAFDEDGSLRADSMARLERIQNEADRLGMGVILGLFYFGQDERLKDEAAVVAAVDNAVKWVLDHGYRNVMIEVNNECNVRYDHAILQPARVHELIERVRQTSKNGQHLLVGTSYGGGAIPLPNVVRSSDFILVHGNGVSDPEKIAEMVRKTRQVAGYTPKPILFNEDDHFDFGKPRNNFTAAISEYASWGYFDPGVSNYRDGYQCPPVNWGINTDRKKEFFRLLAEITGSANASVKTPVSYATTRVQWGAYHGWTNVCTLGNGVVEAVVAPAVGRVMQFRFAGDENGPFWENRALDGKAPNPISNDWGNFGGDKTWPAPQGDWPAIAKRGWPPPGAFDSMPVESEMDLDTLVIKTPVDANYGIRATRRIRLLQGKPQMEIVTRYDKVRGDVSNVGVWIITQLSHPELVVIPVAHNGKGYVNQGEKEPLNLEVKDGLLTLEREKTRASKIGTESSTLIWVGKRSVVRIDSPRTPGMNYPDSGSSAEVYTNPDVAPYVELEMLGPLHAMRPGDSISQTNTYTISARTTLDAREEARKMLEVK